MSATVYHVEHPTPKHVENSIRGIKTAARGPWVEIDLDMLITKDGQIVGCHWDRPMLQDGFYDPERKIHPDARVRDLNYSAVRRLVAPGGYRIQPIETLLHECAKRGVGAVIEPKNDPRFGLDRYWKHLMAVSEDCGAHVRVYGFNPTHIAAAKRAGFQARLLKQHKEH